ncbi:hypothetical protein HYQ46_010422 [Verticillium longisporum]|nr:hypothetical protein HYQ46_010422 [Verticillium longisporum]
MPLVWKPQPLLDEYVLPNITMYLCQYSGFVGVSALAINAAQKRQLLSTCHKMEGPTDVNPTTHNPQPTTHNLVHTEA